MRVTFTEYTSADPEFNADPAFRFAGFIRVEAESLADAKRIVEYFNLHKGDDPENLIARAALLQNPALVHEHRPTKRPYFEVSGSLPVEFFRPYKDWAKRIFGFEGRFPALAIPFKRSGLLHTYIGISQQVEVGETVCFTVATQSEPWNGSDAHDYAERKATGYICEEYAFRPLTPEFIQLRNGHYKRNPKYATGHKEPLQPRRTNDELCRLFVAWWLEHEANDAQRAILAKNQELADLTGPYSLVDWLKGCDGIRYVDPDGDCNYDGKGLMTSRLTFAEFAAL